MRQTLFYIPHEIFGLPVFGWGWAAILWAIVTVALLAWLVRKQGWNEETWSYLPVLLVLGFAATILLPSLEEYRIPFGEGAQQEAIGLPIRGYGVFLLLAVVAGIGLAIYRARSMGLDPEVILSLAFVMFIAGIVGARGVYVYQYWNQQFQLPGDSLFDTARRVVDVSKGGLVVFGSLIGGLGAALLFCHFRKQPFLAIADLIAPSLVLGLAIGRIGCLMNGCCYGGLCDRPWALEFPSGQDGVVAGAPSSPTPPYAHQLALGQLHGFRIGEQAGQVVVREVTPGSVADKAGLKAGDVLVSINQLQTIRPLRRTDGLETSPFSAAQTKLRELYFAQLQYNATKQGPPPELIVNTADEKAHDLTLRDTAGNPTLPAFSLPVHPTQIYAAVNGALLTLLLLAYYPFRRHDGEVIALLLTLYPITRIAEEMIRDDESKSYFLGVMTISQAISAGLLIAAALLWAYVLTRQAGSVLPPNGSLKPSAA